MWKIGSFQFSGHLAMMVLVGRFAGYLGRVAAFLVVEAFVLGEFVTALGLSMLEYLIGTVHVSKWFQGNATGSFSRLW